MIDSELQGSWDQPTRTIVMHNMDASRMQQLAMQFTDKAMVRMIKSFGLFPNFHTCKVALVMVSDKCLSK